MVWLSNERILSLGTTLRRRFSNKQEVEDLYSKNGTWREDRRVIQRDTVDRDTGMVYPGFSFTIVSSVDYKEIEAKERATGRLYPSFLNDGAVASAIDEYINDTSAASVMDNGEIRHVYFEAGESKAGKPQARVGDAAKEATGQVVVDEQPPVVVNEVVDESRIESHGAMFDEPRIESHGALVDDQPPVVVSEPQSLSDDAKVSEPHSGDATQQLVDPTTDSPHQETAQDRLDTEHHVTFDQLSHSNPVFERPGVATSSDVDSVVDDFDVRLDEAPPVYQSCENPIAAEYWETVAECDARSHEPAFDRDSFSTEASDSVRPRSHTERTSMSENPAHNPAGDSFRNPARDSFRNPARDSFRNPSHDSLQQDPARDDMAWHSKQFPSQWPDRPSDLTQMPINSASVRWSVSMDSFNGEDDFTNPNSRISKNKRASLVHTPPTADLEDLYINRVKSYWSSCASDETIEFVDANGHPLQHEPTDPFGQQPLGDDGAKNETGSIASNSSKRSMILLKPMLHRALKKRWDVSSSGRWSVKSFYRRLSSSRSSNHEMPDDTDPTTL